MAHTSEVESLRISVPDDAATIQFAYSTRAAVQLPSEVLYRSTLLHQAISDASEHSEVCLSLPTGFLDAWLEGLQAVGIQTGLSDKEPTSKRIIDTGTTYLELLLLSHSVKPTNHSAQAADFLGDKDAVAALCRQAADMLFAPYIQSGLYQLDPALEQEMHSLPSNLQRSVLASSRLPLLLQLPLLPETLQQTALHAALPTIAATSSLIVRCPPLHDSEYGDPFWKLLGRETSLTSLECSGYLGDHKKFSEDYLSCMTKLTCLNSLCLSGVSIGNSNLPQLSRCLSCLIHLENLDLSGNRIICRALHVQQSGQTDPYHTRGARSPGVLGKEDLENVKQLAQAISHLTALRSLDLSHNALSDSGAEVMGPCIAQLSFLAALNMTNCRIDEHVARDQFMNHVSNCARLQSFRFHSDYGSFQSLKSICSLSSLTYLHLPVLVRSDHDPRMDEDTEGYSYHAIRQLSKLSSLQELHFSAMQEVVELEEWKVMPSIEVIAAVADTISELPILHELRFCAENGVHMSLQGERGIALAKCLSQGPKLQHISLSCSSIDAPGAQALASSLRSLTGLQSFFLSYLDVTGTTVKAVSQLIAEVPITQKLHFAVCSDVDTEDLLCLGEAFRKMGALESLSFNFCSYGSNGLASIAPEMSNFRSLTELSFSDTIIELDTTAALARILGCLKCLIVLEFDRTSIGDEGAVALAPAVGSLTALQRLSFPYNDFSCDAVPALSAFMSNLTAMQTLDFEGNRIGVVGSRELARLVRKLPLLRRLILKFNQIQTRDEEVHGCFYMSMVEEGLDNQIP